MRFTFKVLAFVAGAIASGAFAQDKVTISIATGPTGGVYYPLGGGIANILSKYVPGYSANAESQRCDRHWPVGGRHGDPVLQAPCASCPLTS